MRASAGHRGAVVAVVVSVAFLVAAATRVRVDHAPAAVLVLLAVGWSPVALGLLLAAGPRRSNQSPDVVGTPSDRAGVTTVVRLGDEPPEVARTGILLAAATGPAVVVTATHRETPDELHRLGVPVVAAATVEGALHEAAQAIETDAVLVVSARARPNQEACGRAAAGLVGDVGWVVGESRPVNADRYAPGAREALGARLRGEGRRLGLELWEPDCTLVRTELLRCRPITPGRPWGRWLRATRRAGWRGATTSAVLAHRFAPVGGGTFWPSELAHQRAVVADLADAAATSRGRTRLFAIGLVLRELYALPIGIWALTPLVLSWSSEFPFAVSPPGFLALHVALVGARWASMRVANGLRPSPLRDVLAGLYDIPGSLLGILAVVRRRTTRPRWPVPDRPLVWAALALTLAAAVPLMRRPPSSANVDGATATFSLVLLLALWVFAVRALVQKDWRRATSRCPVALAATVNAQPGTVVDVSPSGAAVTGGFDTIEVGTVVSLAVSLDDGTTLATTADVVDRRRIAGERFIGLALYLPLADRVRWAEQLWRAARVAPRSLRGGGSATGLAIRARAVAHRSPSQRVLTALDRLAAALVALVSVSVAILLALVLLGYQPAVMRSGSMSPALAVGDLVIMDEVTASEVQPGEIVTFEHPTASVERVTHRVRAVTTGPGVAHFETRGDANVVSERWSVPAEATLDRYVGKVPWVGTVMVALGAPPVRWVLAAAGIAVVAVSFAGSARRRPGW